MGRKYSISWSKRMRRKISYCLSLLVSSMWLLDRDDVYESPALDIIELLRQKGAGVHYHDPYVSAIHHNGFAVTGEPDLGAAVAAADCVVG